MQNSRYLHDFVKPEEGNDLDSQRASLHLDSCPSDNLRSKNQAGEGGKVYVKVHILWTVMMDT